jgi:hypothetical protein
MIYFLRRLPTPQSQEHGIRRHQPGYHLDATNRPRISHLRSTASPRIRKPTLTIPLCLTELSGLPCHALPCLSPSILFKLPTYGTGKSYKLACKPTTEPSCLGPPMGRWMACVVSEVVIGDPEGFCRCCCCVACIEASREFPRGRTRKDGRAGTQEGGVRQRGIYGAQTAPGPGRICLSRIQGPS